MVFNGVQLVGGRIAALAWKLPLGVVGPRAARDVDVAPAEVAAAFQGRRGGGNAVDDDAWREEVRVLKQAKRRKAKLMTAEPALGCWPVALAAAVAVSRGGG